MSIKLVFQEREKKELVPLSQDVKDSPVRKSRKRELSDDSNSHDEVPKSRYKRYGIFKGHPSLGDDFFCCHYYIQLNKVLTFFFVRIFNKLFKFSFFLRASYYSRDGLMIC